MYWITCFPTSFQLAPPKHFWKEKTKCSLLVNCGWSTEQWDTAAKLYLLEILLLRFSTGTCKATFSFAMFLFNAELNQKVTVLHFPSKLLLCIWCPSSHTWCWKLCNTDDVPIDCTREQYTEHIWFPGRGLQYIGKR